MGARKKSIWMSYDLGLKGNYNSLFTFLDNHKAKDCGNGLAYFEYENPESLDAEALIEKLKTELATIIEPSSNDRVYVIWRDDSTTLAAIKGKFLFGRRKSAPWNGYGTTNENQSDEAI